MLAAPCQLLLLLLLVITTITCWIHQQRSIDFNTLIESLLLLSGKVDSPGSGITCCCCWCRRTAYLDMLINGLLLVLLVTAPVLSPLLLLISERKVVMMLLLSLRVQFGCKSNFTACNSRW